MIKPDHEAERLRRRERTEQGRSPGQRTTRSYNRGRAEKYPGKRERQVWRKSQEH